MQHHVVFEQFIAADIAKVWDFFTQPSNLSRLTPPELQLRILNGEANQELQEGQIINYLVAPIANISLNWQTKIGAIIPYQQFEDFQLKGPYKYWKHTHIFEKKANGVLIIDKLTYELPFGFLGDWANKWLVANKMNAIFNYRKQQLKKLF